MLELFKQGSHALVGLDISSTSVKLIELGRGQNNSYRVESYAVVPFAINAVVEKDIKDSDDVRKSIALAFQRANVKNRFAALAVAGSKVITKMLQVDAALSDDEIENQITVEADKYIPFPLAEVNIDFQVLGLSENTESLDVQLVACRREAVDSRVDILEDLNIKVTVVDVESYALERAVALMKSDLPEKEEGLIVAVVDIGATMTTLSILLDGQTIYSREEVFGGKLLTEEIQQRYGLSYAEAGFAKKMHELPSDYTPEVLEPFKEAIVLQVGRSLQFFFSSNQHNEVDVIVMSGGTSAIPEIAKLVEERTGTKTILANPFTDMTVAPQVDTTALSNDAPSLMISCGLALRGFD